MGWYVVGKKGEITEPILGCFNEPEEAIQARDLLEAILLIADFEGKLPPSIDGMPEEYWVAQFEDNNEDTLMQSFYLKEKEFAIHYNRLLNRVGIIKYGIEV